MILFIVLVYFQYALFSSTLTEVGKIGSVFALFSKEYFGYLAYGYLLIFLYPLVLLNLTFSSIKSVALRSLTGVLLLFCLLIFQALIVQEGAGIIANSMVSWVSPYIGKAGLWLFVLIGCAVFFMVVLEDKKEQLFKNILETFQNLKPKPKPKKVKPAAKPIKKSTAKNSGIREKRVDQKIEEKVVVTEHGDTAEISIASNDEIKVSETSVQEVNEELPNAVIVQELEENKKLQDEIEQGVVEKPKDFKLPPLKFFQDPPKIKKNKVNESIIDQKIQDLLEKLLMFKIDGDVVRTYTGPVVTTFEFKPAPNVKVSKILNLQDDLAMALKAETIRIQAPIPGKDVVGIEVPNDELETIY
ncbi:MAG: DNA translocase FtsK, partial [Campylobacterota bacterium]|nr:DNA translocase FtsK [Campylobacterota bacterium]